MIVTCELCGSDVPEKSTCWDSVCGPCHKAELSLEECIADSKRRSDAVARGEHPVPHPAFMRGR
jgi:hypothetical protein